MLDGFKVMRASLEAMQQASGQGRGAWRFRGWFCARSTCRRPQSRDGAPASARCDQATGSGRIRPTRLYGASNLLRRDRLPRPHDHVLGRCVELLHQVLHLGAGEGRDIETSLFGVLEELLVAHGGIESGA